MKLRTIQGILLGMVIGIAVGIGVYTFASAKGWSYLTDDAAACAQLLQLGSMGIITPFATGPSPVYYGSGYLPAADYWRLGAIFGVIFSGGG